MATRTELLALRAQIRHASEGRELLSDKRAQLLDALREVADAALAESDALSTAAAAATQALAWAEALDGPEAVRSASLAAAGEIALRARPRSVVGVRFAEIETVSVGRTAQSRGYSIGASSAHVDAVAGAFEDEVQLIVQTAARELRLRRIAAELRKVSRRVNALEHVILPRLEQERTRAAESLEQREREDIFRRLRFARRRDAGRNGR
jgi:V/A-type H+-transporting ATPase subunit D